MPTGSALFFVKPRGRRPSLPAFRWLLGLATAAFVLFGPAVGCTNDLGVFCEEATTDLCKQCWECADSDDEASSMCGLLAETNEEGCRLILTKVCTSDDGVYNGETGKACLDRIDKLSCERLKEKGKPEVCGRLF